MRVYHLLSESTDDYEIVGIDTGYAPSGMGFATTLHNVTYDQLIDKFGEPEKSEGEDKVQVYWEVQIDYRDKSDMARYKHDDIEDEPWQEGDELDHDTVYCHVYDWKYDGDIRTLKQWNVAARSSERWNVTMLLDKLFPASK